MFFIYTSCLQWIISKNLTYNCNQLPQIDY